MKRLWLALGFTVLLQAALAAGVSLAQWFLIDKIWLAENFLNPQYLNQQASVENYANDLKDYLMGITIAVLAIGAICCVVWHVASAVCRIDGPGKAVGLWWIWSLILTVGILLSISSAFYCYYYYITDLVTLNAMLPVYAVGVLLFLVAYYLGTVLPTPPKLRPAVPLASFLPAV
jgi:hypothetical protein